MATALVMAAAVLANQGGGGLVQRAYAAAVSLTDPAGESMTITVSGGPTITSFQVCTGTGFPEAIRPQGVAVEPQTAYANAFRSGKDLIVIKPGDTSVTSIRISAEQR